jgi:hypothetical protein
MEETMSVTRFNLERKLTIIKKFLPRLNKMNLVSDDGLSYFKFDEDSFDGILHGFFTRKGGISPAPWSSLNLPQR